MAIFLFNYVNHGESWAYQRKYVKIFATARLFDFQVKDIFLLFLDPIGNKPAHVAGLYGLSWPCNFLLSVVVVVPVIPVWDGIW